MRQIKTWLVFLWFHFFIIQGDPKVSNLNGSAHGHGYYDSYGNVSSVEFQFLEIKLETTLRKSCIEIDFLLLIKAC